MLTPLPLDNVAKPVAIPIDTGSLPGVLTLPSHPVAESAWSVR